MYRGKRGT
jgi:hypothetical protein